MAANHYPRAISILSETDDYRKLLFKIASMNPRMIVIASEASAETKVEDHVELVKKHKPEKASKKSHV